jgi:hypothetical protein
VSSPKKKAEQKRKQSQFSEDSVSLIEMDVETFPTDNLPTDLAKIPSAKPGSK